MSINLTFLLIYFLSMQNLLYCSSKVGSNFLGRFFATIKNLGVDLKPTDTLVNRHIGPDDTETKQMLKECGVQSVDELIQKAIPEIIRDPNSLDWKSFKEPLAQYQYLSHLKKIMGQNKLFKNYIGYGYYPTITPSVILRNILQNPNWYTPYTPYQAEISQGRLQSLLNYQTVVEELTALQISNASLLDEASAGAEALYMAYNLHEGERTKFFVDEKVFVTTQAVVQTKARNLGIEIVKGKYEDFFQKHNPSEFFGVLVQSPDVNGILHDFTELFKKLSETKTIKVVASDLLALTITKPPGEMGADICFGSAQRFGIPMGYGGPYAGFFATKNISIDKKENVRKMPGRIIGISSDRHDNFALRMALQTRQQHIRRDKATSNICTAQVLLANMSAMYAVYHGPKGLRKISYRVHTLAQLSAKMWQGYGFEVLKQNGKFNFFDTFTINNCQAEKLIQVFADHQINVRRNSASSISLSISQISTLEDIEEINAILSKFTGKQKLNLETIQLNQHAFAESFVRPENFLKQKIFNTMHSENLMMRYIKSLEAKDISLTKSMNTLGSCTMKLNAASEMIPMSWPEMNVHPYVPSSQAKGYHAMIEELRQWLKDITQFDDVSFQSNSGATGEYTGLKTIKTYLEHIGQGHRNICLIPTTAHGTNPASAVLVGLKVVPVNVIEGKIDFNDFKAKIETHSKNLACVMITFPSTAGVYDVKIKEINDLVHQHGGQVYFDGANMNALVGYTSPGYLGADVCHLNLHKTFAIPHGGGGPGMGPIGVRKHLVPHLPTHPFSENYNTKSLGTITSAEYSSASILAISYGYIAMLGKHGVQKATAYAILNANYLMRKLSKYYPILNNKQLSFCSHEFIIDCSQIKKDTKVTEEDIAKRMMDFGFHAPTMSFPTPGTLMIEPTESEDKGELDRFAETLIKIHQEAYSTPEIVKNAPYTAAQIASENWPHKFTREQAAYPLEWVKRRGKFWPTVGRVNNAKGDKVLICSCPEVSAFVE